jgi:hypothetical protein
MLFGSWEEVKMNGLAETAVKTGNARIPIGTILLADEMILPQDLDFALEHQKYCKDLLGEILVRIGALKRDDLDKALRLQTAITSYR